MFKNSYNTVVSQPKNNQRLWQLLLGSIVFLVPSNLFFKLSLQGAYIHGILSDYLIPKIYLSDIFIWSLLILWGIKTKSWRYFTQLKWKSPWIFFPIAFITRSIFSPHPTASLWIIFKILEFSLFGFFVWENNKILKTKIIKLSFIATLIFQSSLGIWQYFSQHSLAGYMLLGEVNLEHSIGLAKDTWWKTGRVLAYGTTPHPNILGGILTIYTLILITNCIKNPKKIKSKILTFFTLSLALITITLTQSISAVIALLLGILLLSLKQKHLSKLTKTLKICFITIFVFSPLFIHLASQYFPNSDSLIRRDYLQTAAIKIIQNHPFLGVGINQFTTRVEEYTQNPEIVRFVQPVHHVGLLWIAETGILGLVFLVFAYVYFQKKFSGQNQKHSLHTLITPLIIFLPISVLDHYLLTQQSGWLLMIVGANSILYHLR